MPTYSRKLGDLQLLRDPYPYLRLVLARPLRPLRPLVNPAQVKYESFGNTACKVSVNINFNLSFGFYMKLAKILKVSLLSNIQFCMENLKRKRARIFGVVVKEQNLLTKKKPVTGSNLIKKKFSIRFIFYLILFLGQGSSYEKKNFALWEI